MKTTYIIIGAVVIIGILYFVFDRSNSGIASTNNTQEINTNTNMDTSTSAPVAELKIEDEVVGTGDIATVGKNVTVQYVGSLMNGTVFDASRNHGDQGFTFTLGAGQVIRGWDMGVAGMKVGGKRKLTIPAVLAYGNQDVGGGLIPANSALVFEVELIKVSK